MEKLFTFYVAIPGGGKTVDEAWASAQESFVQSNIQTPEVVGDEKSPELVILAGLEKAGACAIDMGSSEDTQPLPAILNLGRGQELQTITSSEENILTEALHRLRTVKMDALKAFKGTPYEQAFTLKDFGIPDIDRLLAIVAGEPVT